MTKWSAVSVGLLAIVATGLLWWASVSARETLSGADADLFLASASSIAAGQADAEAKAALTEAKSAADTATAQLKAAQSRADQAYWDWYMGCERCVADYNYASSLVESAATASDAANADYRSTTSDAEVTSARLAESLAGEVTARAAQASASDEAEVFSALAIWASGATVALLILGAIAVLVTSTMALRARATFEGSEDGETGVLGSSPT
ncbi:hypothetical protein Lsed01_00180 [Demequina sediminis]|uniref:Uncharacterized protein n=1 Tax=Demequina sediminis TaxID=1930058 RepID=A0ABP9WG67_9MICO|nr:hypothetical protein [Demequina sediminis]